MRLIMILLVTLMMVACNDETKSATTAEKSGASETTETTTAADGSQATEGAEGDAITTAKGTKITSKWDKYSYMLGVNFGTNFKSDELDVDLSLLMEGMNDAMSDASALSDDDMRTMMQNFQKDMMEMRRTKMEADGKINEAKAAEFLAENKAKEGVVETESGLQYKILKKGDGGTKPTASSQVTVHYEGSLISGDVFDSSYKRDQTSTFPLNGVIKGWTEGMQLMEVGDTFEFYIPPALGYGPMGQRNIPANSLLIFKVELIEVKN